MSVDGDTLVLVRATLASDTLWHEWTCTRAAALATLASWRAYAIAHALVLAEDRDRLTVHTVPGVHVATVAVLR